MLVLSAAVGLLPGIGTIGMAFAADGSSARDAGPVQVLQVAPGIYMMTADGVNVAVETGPRGALVVDAGPERTSNALLAAIRKVTSEPINYLIDTGGDPELVGGNATIAAAGASEQDKDPFAANQQRGLSPLLALAGSGSAATVIARQDVLTRMASEPAVNYQGAGLPTATFTRKQFNFIFNEPIAVVSLPNGHSNIDAAVRFERSDVVVAGAVFDQTRFPVIDASHGGSIQGELDALGEIANTLAFESAPMVMDTGGTLVIPERGPLCDQDDVVVYMDMVATIRARIEYYIDQGKSLAQIEALDPTEGYEARYGSDTGSWTTRDFVTAVYNSLKAEHKGHSGRQRGPGDE